MAPAAYAVDDPPVVRGSKLTNKIDEIIRDNGTRGLAWTKEKSCEQRNSRPLAVWSLGSGFTQLGKGELWLSETRPQDPRSRRGRLSTFLMAAMTDGGLQSRFTENGHRSSETTNPRTITRIPLSEPPQGSVLSDVIDINSFNCSLLQSTRGTNGERNIERPRW